MSTPLHRTTPAPTIRALHLGLGAFFRSHQAYYTHLANLAAPNGAFGYAAFSGRSSALAAALTTQDGLYTLVMKSRDTQVNEVVASVSAAHAGGDYAAWLEYFTRPEVTLLTLTITEAAYGITPAGTFDAADPVLIADAAGLAADASFGPSSSVAKIAAGLLHRRAAAIRDEWPDAAFNVLSCDNVPENGARIATSVRAMIASIDPAAVAWVDANVAFISSMVDRITPGLTAADVNELSAELGGVDDCPVVAEAFMEWVIEDGFKGARPQWELAGAVVTHDLERFESRKLWLLNGSHSLMAYAATTRGYSEVRTAIEAPEVRADVRNLWREACAYLEFEPTELDEYCEQLIARFENPAIQHHLAQIAGDGSQKLPKRILPVLRKHLAAGATPTDVPGCVTALAGFLCHVLRRDDEPGAPVNDARISEQWRESLRDSAPIHQAKAVLDLLEATDLSQNVALLEAIAARARELR